MDADAISLFRELADRPPSEREAYYARHQVPAAVRDEVESLLRFDRDTRDSVGEYVAAAAQTVLASPLAPGARLGPYQVVAPAGAGGMGEVYKARDTRLDRTVAIKILPPAVASNANLQQRFEREARMLAALSHPHICPVFDVGHQDDTAFLVMEYLAGETLADRLTRGPLPLDQALRYAMQIADALDTAHRTGIVHRDLKPGNIMLTSAGAKLVDFGLAKPAPRALGTTLSRLPTTPPMTDRGTIVGTFQYMAPEQLEGGDADSRSDIFAFGAVFYEMITGRKAFEGKHPISVIAAILQREPPPIATHQPLAPPLLDHLVRTCLAKNPEQRWQSAADAMRVLKWTAEGSLDVTADTQRARRSPLTWIVAAVALAGALGVVAAYVARSHTPDAGPAIGFAVSPPEATTFSTTSGFFSLSPDGRSLAFAAESSGRRLLWLRSLDAVAARPLAGTEAARSPFWSPDGRFIAFYAERSLKLVDVSSGVIRTICDVPDTPLSRGGTWSPNGVILFQLDAVGPIYRVPASGGRPIPATTLDESRKELIHSWPSFLPDHRHFLYSVRDAADRGGVAVAALDSPDARRLLDVRSNALYASGYLFFGADGALMAQRFEPRTLRLENDPFPVAPNVYSSRNSWYTSFSVSDAGVLAYRETGTHAGAASLSQLGWVDRAGKPLASVGERGTYNSISLSRDGKKIAIDRVDRQSGAVDIWLIDVTRGATSRLTTHPDPDANPVWSPDDGRIVFASSRDDPGKLLDSLYVKDSDGSRDEQPILKFAKPFLHQHPLDWSLDGRHILFERYEPQKSQDLWILPLSGPRTPFPVAQTEFNEVGGRFSPDGQFVTYASNETGRYEVYVRSLGATGKWQISVNGGAYPIWSRDGREIFYISPESALTAVPVRTKGRFEAGSPSSLFDVRLRVFMPEFPAPYAVTANGQRFLLMQTDALTTPITISVNWQSARRSVK